MAGSLAPVMYWAVCMTLCNALWLEAKQLPYQAVMQLVRMFSMSTIVHDHLLCLDHVSKLNDGVGVVFGHAVIGEQGVQEGTEYAPMRGHHVQDQHGRCVGTYPYHLGRPVSKSKIQLQREVFSPRVLSLLMSFEGTMVLNSEL